MADQVPLPTPSLAAQAYLTHCLAAESVFNSPGFSVRAASTKDSRLLRELEGYPPYELPVALWSKDPSPEETPRRLALVRLADGRQALFHTAYLQYDTVGRRGNYFTHAFVGQNIGPLEGLRSWASPEWQVGPIPSTDGLSLPTPKRLPQGSDLTQSSLTEFLRGRNDAGDVRLATTIAPPRLSRDDRGQLLGCCLVAVASIMRTDKADRQPLYVRAEPGLLAMLLFGAASLLPRSWVAELTFSTYESPDTTLRSFDRAWVVGTFVTQLEVCLPSEYLDRYGMGIDTVHLDNRSSALHEPLPAVVKQLLRLAEDGEWDAVDRWRGQFEAQPVSLVEDDAAVVWARAEARLARDAANLDDISLLQGTEDGRKQIFAKAQFVAAALLQKRGDGDEAIAKRFRAILNDDAVFAVLKTSAIGFLKDGRIADWNVVWKFLGEIRPKSRGMELEAFVNALGTECTALSLEARQELRREWLVHGDVNSRSLGIILTPKNASELGALCADRSLPPEWKSFAIRVCLFPAKPPPGFKPDEKIFRCARRHLESDVACFGSIIRMRKNVLPQAMNVLVRLLGEDGPSAPLLDALLQSNLRDCLPHDGWPQLGQKFATLNSNDWRAYWSENSRLATLLTTLEFATEARPIWQHYIERFDGKFLNDDRQIKVFCQLATVLESLGEQALTGTKLVTEEQLQRLQYMRLRAALWLTNESHVKLAKIALSPESVRQSFASSGVTLLKQLHKTNSKFPWTELSKIDGADGMLVELLFKRFHDIVMKDPAKPSYANLGQFFQIFLRFRDWKEPRQAIKVWWKLLKRVSPDQAKELESYFKAQAAESCPEAVYLTPGRK